MVEHLSPVQAIAATENYGVYHCTNEGTCSWADFAEAVEAAPAKPARKTARKTATGARRPRKTAASKSADPE